MDKTSGAVPAHATVQGLSVIPVGSFAEAEEKEVHMQLTLSRPGERGFFCWLAESVGK